MTEPTLPVYPAWSPPAPASDAATPRITTTTESPLLAGELHHLLSAIQSTSSVLVFIHRRGALEPDVVEVAAADNVPTEGAVVLHVNLAQ